MSIDDLLTAGRIEANHSLAGMTTYKFGGRAAWYADVSTVDDLKIIVAAGREAALSLFVLGRGSNVVVADTGYPGLVVRLVGEFNEMTFAANMVVAGAGVSLPRLARACAAADRGGLEFYVGIPGSVGGAVVMNAGGHGSDTAEWLIDASILDTTTSEITSADPAGLDLSYRHSRLTSTDVVLQARFRTVEQDRSQADETMREITSWRREHQPGGTFNAGSVFKNPPGDAAGRLIDSAGLKGYAVGGVAVSERHANFFVASPDASAQDVYDLVTSVRRIVHDRTGVDLRPEIRFVGDFGEEI